MTARTAGRNGRPWRRLATQIKATQTHCHLCRQPVDKNLPPRHPLSATVDHVIPLNKGGAPTDLHNLRLAHYNCNAAKRDTITPPRHTRTWL